jgi:ribulose-phosphate 3-epimerase
MKKQPLISPSLMACDLLHIAREVSAIESAGADMLHIDVMDGHYVPNMMFSPALVKSLSRQTKLPIDVHIMASNPSDIVPWFIDAGANWISFHPDTESHAYRLLSFIQNAKVKAGIALNPGIAWEVILPLLPVLDFVLVMTVNPGFGGQTFLSSMLSKISAIKQAAPYLTVSVDGGIHKGNAKSVCDAGADILVAGSSIFSHNVDTTENLSAYTFAIQQLKML